MIQTGCLLYLAVINLLTFLTWGDDKQRAKKGQWRVPEKRLWELTALGGSFGALAGMYVFHHKTSKILFRTGVPGILFIHILILTTFVKGL